MAVFVSASGLTLAQILLRLFIHGTMRDSKLKCLIELWRNFDAIQQTKMVANESVRALNFMMHLIQ